MKKIGLLKEHTSTDRAMEVMEKPDEYAELGSDADNSDDDKENRELKQKRSQELAIQVQDSRW